MNEKEGLIPKHGGYRRLKSFRIARLIYDMTVRFCELYVEKRSRTYDQMIQAARSGVQNIAEGSPASATSKKTELKLTNVGRSSLEELRLDYEDFLRQKKLSILKPQDPVLMRFKARQCSTLAQVQEWTAAERRRVRRTGLQSASARMNTDGHRPTRTNTDSHASDALSSAMLAANAVLSLINIDCYLLDRQIEKLAKAFEQEGGFSERLYKVRSSARKRNRVLSEKR